ncbi:MAG: ribosomal RNA small subunit methyltransferase A [Candidatus Moranbacteria bacterium]|nr:ribosomal RNA small subunit methyltransferase A [Candidatus Moranbacteria bacterium]
MHSIVSPKKSLGQNFLRDERVVSQIADSVSLDTSCVVEIGPGEGVLTKKLAQKKVPVVAIELDDRLVSHLEKMFSSSFDVHIVSGNVLRVNISEVLSGLGYDPGRYVLVGNLPYYITSAIIRLFLESENQPQEMTIMVQKEVADRIVAKPGQMSLLSLSVQYFGFPETLFTVSKDSFSPIPKVDSSVVRISRIHRSLSLEKERLFFRVARVGFSARRKTLVNNLSTGFGLSREQIVQILLSLELPPTVRAQELTVSQWIYLSEHLSIISSN